MSGSAHTLHASCVLVDEAGVLIRGPSGSGKSTLARDLILQAGRAGRFARLVSDDRVRLEARAGRLLARAVAAIEGCLEIRGVGLVPVPWEPASVVRLVVDCLKEDEARLPEVSTQTTTVGSIGLPRLGLRVRPGVSDIILWRLRDWRATSTLE